MVITLEMARITFTFMVRILAVLLMTQETGLQLGQAVAAAVMEVMVKTVALLEQAEEVMVIQILGLLALLFLAEEAEEILTTSLLMPHNLRLAQV
jgi:hypothetical protein